MASIDATIEVQQPLRTVYNQWTQFEEFPRFMEGVEEVVQLDEATLQWQARIAGVKRAWKARIVEQEPDRVVSWASIEGTRHDGRVTFEPLGPDTTRVHLALDLDPQDLVEKAGEVSGLIEMRAQDDLERFREFMEARPIETGAWRGEIHDGEVTEQDG
ncbi:MAG TPA: SRPBCC family protein [Acidimicrobiia bacterium]|nr:SRPBCC family protein [Acidimicrobiia bacterium]